MDEPQTLAVTSAELTFICMDVFTLERVWAKPCRSQAGRAEKQFSRRHRHGRHADMEALFLRHAPGVSSNWYCASALSKAQQSQDNLKLAASRFLGTGRPSFHYKTDLVAFRLFDAAGLLQKYAVYCVALSQCYVCQNTINWSESAT